MFAVISLILLALGQYDGVVYQTLLLLVYNVSYTWALYALVRGQQPPLLGCPFSLL